MRTAARFGYFALILIFVLSINLSCSSDSGSPSNNNYTIEGTVTPSGAGTITPANGEYEEGEQVEVSAEANDTWMFSSWEGDISGSENPVTVTVESDMAFTALFEKLQYSLDVTVEGGGTVEENIVQTKMTDYETGTEVELNAIADEGWVFVEWQGDLSGNENPQTLAMDEAKAVTAVFQRKEYPLTVNTEGEGNVTEVIVEEPAKDYQYETVVEITANPAEGWQFARWEGDAEGTENPSEIIIDGEKEVTAVFERAGYELTVEVTGQGSVDQELVEEASKTNYPYESVIELTANPESGWKFVRWEGALDGNDNPAEITMDSDKTVTAVFANNSFDLDVTIDGEGSVSQEVTGKAKTYEKNTIVELTAEPEDGWLFDHWEGDLSGNNNPKEITIDKEKNVTAVFEEVEYKVNISIDGVGDVSLNPDKKTYTFGEEIEIEADPGDSWAFSNWKGDLGGDENPTTITVDSDLSITAVFGSVASVRTEGVSDMRITSVTGGGIVEDDGDLDITERGVCWGEEEDPDLSDSCTQDGDGTGEFSSDITGLRQGVRYYVRAYASNKAGTSFGKNVEFQAGYISHNYVDGLTPSSDSQFQNRNYKLVESNWKNGVGKIWIEKNLGATGPVKVATDSDEDRAGWYFQFDRKQGYYHDGTNRIPNTSWGIPVGDFDWRENTDPCQAAFGSDSDDWRVPTRVEWQGYIDAPPSSGGPSRGDYDAAYNSDLRLHAAGALDDNTGDVIARGTHGTFWSSTSEVDSEGLLVIIDSSESEIESTSRGLAATIRCVKD